MATVVHRIPYGTDAWYDFRKTGIGGSDISTIMNLNPYQSAVRLFYEKLGEVSPLFETNEFMFWGQQNEDTVADVWQYYDGIKGGYIKNKEIGNLIRRNSRVNGFSVNDKYPWLFGSYDRVINISGGFRMDGDDPLKKRIPITRNCPLEIKTITDWASKQWTDGLPVYYLPQIYGYQIILETDYAELAVLKNGNTFEFYTLGAQPELKEAILDRTKAWWDNFLVAKEIYREKRKALFSNNIALIEETTAALHAIEPEPDGSQDYEAFMSQRALATYIETEGDPEILEWCKREKHLRALSKGIDIKIQELKNKMVHKFGVEHVEKFNFPDNGYIKYMIPKNGTKHQLYNMLHEKPLPELIKKQVDSL